MVQAGHVLAILVATATILSGCADHAKAPATALGPAGTGSLRGVVVDQALHPMRDVRLDLDATANTTSDANGLFRFDGVEPGAHVVRARKAGFSDTVAQADVRAAEEGPLVKLVLVADITTLAYADTQAIDGYVECGLYGASVRYATCGTGNVASLIACSTFNVCLGNVSADRYIVVERFDRQPDFLVAEVTWTATQDLGKAMQVYIGTATPEDLAQASTNDYNGTIGESPLYVTMNKTMLVDSQLGQGAYFLSQTFAAPSLNPCPGVNACGVGVVAQQRFTYYLTSFFGYQPPASWRFVVDGAPPAPPAP
jgi:hypothetical protein